MTLWRCFITLLLSGSVALFGGTQVFDASRGNLSAEPPSPFLLGSDLVVYCHIAACERRSQVSLVWDKEPVALWRRDQCSPVVFKLTDVQRPRSTLHCKLREAGLTYVVGGLDLRGGRPPDKPKNITCATTSRSHWAECRWRRGFDTHVPTSYNVSLTRTWYWTSEGEELVLPGAVLDVNEQYQLVVSARNQFGRSQSDPFTLVHKDILVPESPRITHVYFENSSTPAAVLRWETPEDSSNLTAAVGLRPDGSSSWDAREVTRLGRDEVRVDGLEPLVDYHFRIKMCVTGAGKCSKWSPAVMRRTPGKGPSQPPRVWRMLSNRETSLLQNVTVLWKAPHPESYSGQVEGYIVVLGQGATAREEMYGPSLKRVSLLVPADLPPLAVTVVTSYGRSPPAVVPLGLSGDPGPALRLTVPEANGRALLVSWEWSRPQAPGSDEWYYVLDWISVPVGKSQLGWMKVPIDQNEARITGMSVGVRYNISVYCVNGRGVSTPSSILAYSGQLKPAAGPNVSVLAHRATRLLVQWEDPAVEQQGGFITNYTIYLWTLHVHSQEIAVVVPARGRRQAWLECPEGTVAIQMSASTSAGEGRRGNLISSRPKQPAAGPAVLVLSVIGVAGFTVLVACCTPIRRRIKEQCVSWGPDWLVKKLPKPGNSQAIKLLEMDAWSEPSLSHTDTDSDPPLSPISFASEEDSQPPLLSVQNPTDAVVTETPDHGYKPQLTAVPRAEEPNQDQTYPTEEDLASGRFGPPLGNLLFSVELEPSTWLQNLELDLNRSDWWGTEDHAHLVDLQKGETLVAVSAVTGYVPQICIPSSGQEAE
ncbi:interleukin-23 receptor isoform X2 [Syngnathoides biaculeatus]|uniref:interleukin-23 receptor isoform X2 n=1 Tax=Syngnathoides biaculeatus TaxID=300417 RepID=UPI002ADE6C43|nr:interleukin-23 receptor isoform X2 [Syngnathoides biaculeatus]